jgi:hypothetical protein
MRGLVWLGAVVLFGGSCFGQHLPGAHFAPPGGHGTGPRFGPATFNSGHLRGGFFVTPQRTSFDFGIPPLSAIPPLGVNTLGVDVLRATFPGFRGFDPRLGSLGFSGFGGFPLLPVIADGYGEAGERVIVLQPIQMPYQAPRKPEIAHPAMHEYKEAAETSSALSGAQQPVFTLAMKDGTTTPAILVWVQKGVLHYIDPAGKTVHVPLSTLDRDATQRLNRDKNLELHLPADGVMTD